MRQGCTALIVLALCFLIHTGALGMSSPNYLIDTDVLSSGGGEGQTPNYGNLFTLGQPFAIGVSSSAHYRNSAGFWYALIAVSGKQLLGDMNGDGVVDISDVILELRIALALDPVEPCSNINGDTSVDISDVILTLRMALGLDPIRQCTQ